MIGRLGLLHHTHTGKLRPHEHTAYAPLAIMLLFLSMPLGAMTVSAIGVRPGPSSGSIGLSGTVPSVPPKTAATIQTPANNTHFSISPVTIAGSCPTGTLVEIYKNDIFAGSAPCTPQQTFSLQADLMFGQNKVVARVYDDLNQPGPDSASLTLFYDALPAQSASSSNLYFGGSQILLNTNAVFRGTFPGQNLTIPIDILGGTAPYAMNIEWGDSKNQVVSLASSAAYNANHVYDKAGTYRITIQATDATGRVAFLTITAIVNGQAVTIASTLPSGSGSGITSGPLATVLMLWPLYTATFAVVVSFWLGERREKSILMRHGLPPRPTLLHS